MTEYARIVGGIVAELWTAPESLTPAQCFYSDIAAQFEPVPSGVAAEPGWTVIGGVWSAPITPPETLAQQAAALLAGGLTVTSTGTPAISGTYACDAQTIGFIQAEMISLMKYGTFADGTTSVDWEVVGGLRTLTVVEAETIFTAIGAFVAAVRKCIIGAPGAALPSASVTIA